MEMLSSMAIPKLILIVAHRNKRTSIFIKTISNTDTGIDIFEFSHQEHVSHSTIKIWIPSLLGSVYNKKHPPCSSLYWNRSGNRKRLGGVFFHFVTFSVSFARDAVPSQLWVITHYNTLPKRDHWFLLYQVSKSYGRSIFQMLQHSQ